MTAHTPIACSLSEADLPRRLAEQQRTWRSRLAAPALAAVMIACCLAIPLIAGAVGALTAGALLGVGAAVVVLLATCLYAGFRLTSGRRC